ncbi:MAG TPA: hypothetical protein VFN82_08270 [Solirubrobacterales bacterium]|nr:hypothetical protein [Solirubrobacterales bacterium]
MSRSGHLIRLGAVAATLTVAFAAAAFGARKVECLGNVCIADNGGISPSKLPRHGSAPITARLVGEISTRDGSHPPALRSVELDVDRTIGVDAVGLPTCKAGSIEAVTTTEARRVCGSALVGSGRAEVEVAFPESTPFSATGPVLIFNGGVHGGTTRVLLHAFVAVPVPTAIVTTATVKRIHRGRFGLQIAARIPPIAGAAGSVTKFELKIGRRFTYEGRKRSFLTASCPTGSWVTKGEVLFSDGTRGGLTHVFPCTPHG